MVYELLNNNLDFLMVSCTGKLNIHIDFILKDLSIFEVVVKSIVYQTKKKVETKGEVRKQGTINWLGGISMGHKIVLPKVF